MKITKKLRTCIKSGWVRYILLTLVLYFVGKTLFNQLSRVDFSNLTISWVFLAGSVFFEILARCLTGLGYERMLAYFKCPLPLVAAVSIAWVSFIGKYLPGKFFLIAIAMFFFKRYKIPLQVAGIVPLLSTLMTVFAALVLSIPLLFLYKEQVGFSTSLGIIIIAFFGIFFSFKPKLIFLGFKKIFKKTHDLINPVHLENRYLRVCLGIAFFQCVCFGVSTWFIAKAITSVNIFTILWFISITTFANTMGLFAFFSPAGIGVKDGICFLGLGNIVGTENAALITVIIRIIYTLMDLGSAGAGLIYLGLNKTGGHANQPEL